MDILLFVAVAPVAPLVGAWIESLEKKKRQRKIQVAPLVGAWIESINNKLMETLELVAPLVGAWIERNIFMKEFCIMVSLLL